MQHAQYLACDGSRQLTTTGPPLHHFSVSEANSNWPLHENTSSAGSSKYPLLHALVREPGTGIVSAGGLQLGQHKLESRKEKFRY